MDINLQVPFLLAASPQLRDPVFKQAVILMVEYDSTGAMGFVINNKSHMTLSEVVAFEVDEVLPAIPVWNAGPNDSSSGFILHNQKRNDLEREIAPGICLSASQETLKQMVQAVKSGLGNFVLPDSNIFHFKLLVGYAGWAPGQLEEEFRNGSWIQAPLNKDIIFSSPDDEMWARTIASIGVQKNNTFAPYQRGWFH